ncbi:uncharacterized protein LOC118190598 [Stegodyphus dumicola]|uniref:uncharacterized protein LOC118190598 n=1 Tax=Stegodyphus dumicola TaxID=202533 RepID=UPI0015AF44EC|nr:uncharacterized protein LOC118190598 [Stegodyphus dumicola]
MELICGIIILTILGNAIGGSPTQYADVAVDERLPSKDFVIFTDGGPVPNYLLESSYKIVPLRRMDNNRRTSRRSTQTTSSRSERVVTAQRRGSPVKVDERSATQMQTRLGIRRPTLRQSPRSFRREDVEGSSKPILGRYVQRVKSPEGPVAIPIDDPKKGNALSSTKDQNEALAMKTSQPSPNTVSDNTQSKSESYIPNSDNSVDGLDGLPARSRSGRTFVVPQRAEEIPNVVYEIPAAIPVAGPAILINDPKPYAFGYGVNDGIGTTQYRQEATAGDGIVKGNYGYKDYQGLYRQVNYVADKNGFHAVLMSNEPGVVNADTADVAVIAEPPPPAAIVEANKYIFSNGNPNEVILLQ